MAITSTGDQLNLLIHCDCSLHQDWMTFCAWYSAYQNLPDIQTSVLCARSVKSGQTVFSWPYRCDVRYFQHENVEHKFGCTGLNKLYSIAVALQEGIAKLPLIVIDSSTMALRQFSKNTLSYLNDPSIKFGISDSVWYLNNISEDIINAAVTAIIRKVKSQSIQHLCLDALSDLFSKPEYIPGLQADATENGRHASDVAFATYNNHCGRFRKDEWLCKISTSPFLYAAQLGSGYNLSVNEQAILDLWSQMGKLYGVLC